MQDLIRKLPGVISTRVGYSGGDVPNATYRNHGNHAEAIEVVFDPDRTSYRRLLETFFQIHDPTTRERHHALRGRDLGARPWVDARDVAHDRGGDVPDPAQHRRRARARPPEGIATCRR
jgi:hypothetical protein